MRETVFFIPPMILLTLGFAFLGFIFGHKKFSGAMLLLFIAVFVIFGTLFLSMVQDIGLDWLIPSYLKPFLNIFRSLLGR